MDPRDEWVRASRALLDGLHVEDLGSSLPSHRYLDKEEEEHGRVALAALLASGRLPPDICRLLAALIVPDGYGEPAERTLIFKFRSRSARRQSTNVRDSEIVARIKRTLEDKSGTVESAITEVAEETGLEQNALWKIWSAYSRFRYDDLT